MPKDAKKKERKRLKREKKKALIRKRDSVSPYRRIAEAGHVVECWINSDWRERGQATPFVLVRQPGGAVAMATFMVDLWCAGLKDAWGKLDITRDEFDRIIEAMSDRMDRTLVKVDVAEVRQVVAGALRFAKQNGFRLPPHYDRWVGFCGDLGDWLHTADLSHFGINGNPRKLRWVGPMSDLRKRLIGSTGEEFLAQPNVEVITDMGEEDFYDDDDYGYDHDDDEDEEDLDDDEDGTAFDGGDEEALAAAGQTALAIAQSVDRVAGRVEHAVRRWCFAEGIAPNGQLKEAVRWMLLASFESAADLGDDTDPDEDEAADEWREAMMDRVAVRLSTMPQEDRTEMIDAVRQVAEFMQTFKNSQALLNAVSSEPAVDGSKPEDAPPAVE